MGFQRNVALLAFMVCAAAYGQNISGSIRGVVTDPTGALVPKATVTITNTDKNAVIRGLTTGSDGSYVAALLPIGHYKVEAEAAGFQKSVVQGINVNANDELVIDVGLPVASTTSTVNVEATPLAVNLESATAAGLFTQTQVTELPTNNRNYEQFVAIAAPGISAGVGDQIYIGVTGPSGLSNAVNFSINGNRPTQNNWTIDGADNVDRGSNLTLLNYPSLDAIEEFKVLRGQYSPEYGRSSSGQINVITRSGSSQFHGDAYEFFRNNELNANRFFNNRNSIPRPALRQNDFGYTLGGPVFIPGKYNSEKNKTFFFFSQEFRRVITYGNFSSGEAPTAAELQGNFPSAVCLNADCTSTGTRVANINPTAQAYLKDVFSKLPAANVGPSGVPQYNFVGRNVFNARQELIKIDHYFGQKFLLSGRYINDSIPTQEPGGLFTGSALPGVANTSTNAPGRGALIRGTYSITPTLVNEAGYAYSYGGITSQPVGFDSSVLSPDVRPKLPFPSTLGRIPSLAFGLGESLGGFGPYRDFNYNHNIFDTLSWIRGSHSYKFGFTLNHYTKDENDAGNNVGTFSFNTTNPAGNDTFQQEFASFLTGEVAQFTQLKNDARAIIHQNQFEAFAQDQWRARRNLSISYGVRYTLFYAPTDGHNQLANFDPVAYQASRAPQIDASGNLVAGTSSALLNGVIINHANSPYGGGAYRTPKLNFGPRLGIAWDPFSDGKTSIRTGYGIFYDSPSVNPTETNVLANPPFVGTVSISNTKLDNPAGGTPDINLSPSSLSAVQPNWHLAYSQEWSLDIQRQLPANLLVDVGYYGSKGTHLPGVIDINQPLPGAYITAGLVKPGQVITDATTPLLNRIRPYLGFDAINMFQPRFNSTYNSLQAQLVKRFGGSSTMVVNYTYSHGLTDAQNDVRTAQNGYNIGLEKGSTSFDRRHIFNANFVYELPFFKAQQGFAGRALGGWQLSGIVIAQAGLPLTVTGGRRVDPAGLGLLDILSNAGRRPDQIGDPNANAPHTLIQWFNKSAFANIPAGVFRAGTAARGAVRGPGAQRWDLGLGKTFKIYEQLNMQFRAEAFNVFNHTNFDAVNTSLASSLFGRVTTARDPRILQLGLKLKF